MLYNYIFMLTLTCGNEPATLYAVVQNDIVSRYETEALARTYDGPCTISNIASLPFIAQFDVPSPDMYDLQINTNKIYD